MSRQHVGVHGTWTLFCWLAAASAHLPGRCCAAPESRGASWPGQAIAVGARRSERHARLVGMDTSHWQDVSPQFLEPVRENYPGAVSVYLDPSHPRHLYIELRSEGEGGENRVLKRDRQGFENPVSSTPTPTRQIELDWRPPSFSLTTWDRGLGGTGPKDPLPELSASNCDRGLGTKPVTRHAWETWAIGSLKGYFCGQCHLTAPRTVHEDPGLRPIDDYYDDEFFGAADEDDYISSRDW